MSSDRAADVPMNLLEALLTPLRLPGRVASDIETLVSAVVALQSDATQHLRSVDDRAGTLVGGLRELQEAVGRIEARVDRLEQDRMQTFLEAVESLQGSIDRIEGRVENLESVEETIEERMVALRGDLNARMLELRDEVRDIRPAMDQIANDVKKIDQLLPEPSGPLSRLKDTLSSG